MLHKFILLLNFAGLASILADEPMAPRWGWRPPSGPLLRAPRSTRDISRPSADAEAGSLLMRMLVLSSEYMISSSSQTPSGSGTGRSAARESP